MLLLKCLGTMGLMLAGWALYSLASFFIISFCVSTLGIFGLVPSVIGLVWLGFALAERHL